LASTTGTVPTSYTYEPYGKTTVSGTASANFFGFTGRENDSTGTLSLYNYRIRSYSPALQRFLTEDPIGFAGGDVNLYAYVGNSPTNFTDPLGLEREGGDGGCGFLGLRCVYRFFQQRPRVVRDVSGCVFGAIRVFVTIVPIELAAPPSIVGAIAAGCAGGVATTEASHGGT
jgi:RHS repeat-associated protein